MEKKPQFKLSQKWCLWCFNKTETQPSPEVSDTLCKDEE